MSPGVAARQPRELVEALVFRLSPVCHTQLRSEDGRFLFKVWAAA